MDSKQYIKISPDFDVLYVDAEGCSFDASGDEISNDDLEMGPLFCFAIPGIEEWLRRYVDATDFVDTVTDPSFDWKTWHCEGLLFAKAIREQLPRCYKLFYEPPYEDKNNTESCIEIDERIDNLIEVLGREECHNINKPSFMSHIDFRAERNDNYLSVLFQGNKNEAKVKIPFNSISEIRNWLEHIIEAREAKSIIECSGYKLHFFKQAIGAHTDMGQFWIVKSGKLHPVFTAYVNIREFVVGMYLSLMTKLGFYLYKNTDGCPSDEDRKAIWKPYNGLKSDIIESCIGGQSLTRKSSPSVPINETLVMFPDYGGCIFWDTMGVGVGDSKELYLETDNIKLNVPGLDRWSDFYDNHDKSQTFEEYWQEGWELAKIVRQQLPDNIDLYYMCYDPKQPERKIDYNCLLPHIIVPKTK